MNVITKSFERTPDVERISLSLPFCASTGTDFLLLTGVCAVLFFYGLSTGELYRTETLRAIIAQEFLRTGNWLVPTLYGHPLFTKPPGMYAAIAICSWPVGEVREWTARLPAAIAASLTVFSFYLFFGRRFGRGTGLTAALMLPVSLMWLDKATSAEIDMVQVAWISGSLLCFFRALETAEERDRLPAVRTTILSGDESSFRWLADHRPTSGHEWFWWLAALLCVTGGFLTKWTAPAFFYGTAIPLLWWRGRLRLLFGWRHLSVALVALGLAIAWIGAAVAQTGWNIFYDTVSREALMRLSPQHHHRAYPWWESLRHPLVLWAGALPWSFVALAALRPGFGQLWNEQQRRVLQGLHCWLWPNLLFWSLIPEHAPRHSMPIIPAFTGLAAIAWTAWTAGRLSAAPRLLPYAGKLLTGVLCLWLIVKLAYVHAITPIRLEGREPQAKGALLARLVPDSETLYLLRLKDEGIMFYYRRPVRRVETSAELPSGKLPVYCVLTQEEHQRLDPASRWECLSELQDEQGAPIYLMRLFSGH